MEKVLLSDVKYTENQEVRIRYEHACSSNGVTFIFVMGLSIDAFGWSNEFLSQFVTNGFGVIRFDNRCTGGSSFVKNFGKTKFTLSDMAADAIAILDAERIDAVHAVGISLGGMVVQQMALDFPSRVRSITSIMSGAHIHPFNLSFQSYLTFLRMGWTAAKPRRMNDLASYAALNTEILMVLDSQDVDESELHWIAQISAYQLAHDQKIRPDSALHQMIAVLRSGSRYEPLEQSTIPKLVIHGESDPLIPKEHSVKFYERIPNSKLFLVEDMGHTIPKRYYSLIYNEIVAFIKAS